MSNKGILPGITTTISVKADYAIDEATVLRRANQTVEALDSLDPFNTGWLLNFIHQRDQIIHDLMIDKQLIDQASLPPNVLRQENESLREMNAKLHEQVEKMMGTMRGMEAEIERLRIENENERWRNQIRSSDDFIPEPF